MAPLPTELRRQLERAVLQARDVSERAAETALKVLAVNADQPFATLSDDQKAHRRALRARMTQLAETDTAYDARDRDARGFRPLVEEVAYEQWHRMLFARFLAENGLLLHPDHGVGVSLEECAELASGLGEPDEWMVAARFAAEMLPGIFRRDDPSARVRFAANDRVDLVRILNALPEALFQADDALGWVYQFWQTKAKDEVNKSGRKVGGKDLFPVTQLFTEHYMVRFLLENSLGAWWAARYPQSPLIKEWEYLRLDDNGAPAAGTFPGWPAHAAEVTVMDPCCGSGHFLVAAAEMLRNMRIEEEGLTSAQAAGAVLRDNLHGLEIDPRCTQLAAFALAFDAWKAGLNPKETVLPNVACSGVAVSGQLDAWKRLAGTDVNLEHTLEQLYRLFRNAPDLGSLINPAALSPKDQLFTTSYADAGPLLRKALAQSGDDPAALVFGAAAEGAERAGALLTREYTLISTNVPFRTGGDLVAPIRDYIEKEYPEGRGDLAAAFLRRCLDMAGETGTVAIVTPHNWLFLTSYTRLRKLMLDDTTFNVLVQLGPRAFETISGEVVRPVLAILESLPPSTDHSLWGLDVSIEKGALEKARALRAAVGQNFSQLQQIQNPDHRIILGKLENLPLLQNYATGAHGLGTKDGDRFIRCFWELPLNDRRWVRHQSTVKTTTLFGGLEHVLLWEDGRGSLYRWIEDWKASGWTSGVWKAGTQVWGQSGVIVSQMSNLPVALYLGQSFDNNTAAIIPRDPSHTLAIWAFCSSSEFGSEIRKIDKKVNVTNSTMVKVPFDLDKWNEIAKALYPDGLPDPSSERPTQWIFKGGIAHSEEPLQVAVARLVGYRWPDQAVDALEAMSDTDGIVCIRGFTGAPDGAERLRSLLAAAYGSSWQPGTLERLLSLVSSGGRTLEQWLRDVFFEQHCKLFHHRPFVWQIWDGKRDGFSALVNYRRLDHPMLQKLTYSYLGSWIDRQRDLASQGIAGADDLLAAALTLQRKLAQILEGEKPFDIYVRWKKKHEQPIGWNPDLDDGVRLNIRPFMEAGVLRWKPNIKWEKDRGKNPDGSDRINDIHLSLAEKREARRAAGIA